MQVEYVLFGNLHKNIVLQIMREFIMEIKQKNSLMALISRYIDIKTFVLCALLVGIGLLSLYSATVASDPDLDLFFRQLLSAMIGIALLFITANIPTHFLKTSATFFYIITNILLVVVLIFGSEVYGTKGWLRLGGFSLQPSELSKISLLLITAKYLSKKGTNVANIWDLSKITAYFLLPFILVNLQPDFGTSLVLLAAFVGILFWGGFDAFYMVLAFCCATMFIASLSSINTTIIVGFISGVALLFFGKRIMIYLTSMLLIVGIAFASPVFYSYLSPHQQARINVFITPNADPQGAGYNVIQSLLAVGSGGITGKGYMEGTLTQLRYIPMQWTDFIFSVPAEEFGLIGSAIIVILLLSIVYRGINIAANSKETFNSVIAFGASTIFLFHIIVNIGMVLGLLPVMGIPLPFLSYGGTSLISNLILVGLLMNIHKNNSK